MDFNTYIHIKRSHNIFTISHTRSKIICVDPSLRNCKHTQKNIFTVQFLCGVGLFSELMFIECIRQHIICNVLIAIVCQKLSSVAEIGFDIGFEHMKCTGITLGRPINTNKIMVSPTSCFYISTFRQRSTVQLPVLRTSVLSHPFLFVQQYNPVEEVPEQNCQGAIMFQ